MKDTKSKIYGEETRTVRKVIAKVPSEFVQFYSGGRHYMSSIQSPIAWRLFLLIIESMDDSNAIHIDVELMRTFTETPGNKTNDLTYVRRLVSQMTEARVLIRLSRGAYIVNPLIAWRKSPEQRGSMIQSLIESGHKLEYEHPGKDGLEGSVG